MRKPLLGRWEALRLRWTAFTLYHRFESMVALMLKLIISMVILVALYRLFVGVLTGLVFGILDPLEIILVLGMTYWLLRERDDRLLGAKSEAIGEGDRADANELPSLAKMCTASGAMEKTTTT